jgi:hypothetical protein
MSLQYNLHQLQTRQILPPTADPSWMNQLLQLQSQCVAPDPKRMRPTPLTPRPDEQIRKQGKLFHRSQAGLGSW